VIAQLDLIERPVMARARAAGHEGAQRAADKTERVVDPDWTSNAVEAIRKFASQQPALFTMEMCRGVIELQGTVSAPTDKRAWGAATLCAVRAGYIERTKTYHPAVSSNGSDKPCYRRGPKAMQP
jgi:hypothetical protein